MTNKKWIFPLVLIITLFAGFYFYNKYHVAPTINLQTLDLSDLQGDSVNMEAFKGKKIILSFGASWCGNCIEEMKDLNSVKNSELQDVEVIIVSDEPLETVNSFKNRKNYPFTFLKMNKAFHEIGINAIPTSYIINTKLQVMKETVGYIDWKDPSTAQHFGKLME